MPEAASTVVLHAAGLDGGMGRWLTVPSLRCPSLIPPDRVDFSLGDLATEVAAGIEEPVHLVGCSLGAMVAIRVADGWPEKVRSLVLIGAPAAVPRDPILDRARETQRRGAADMVEETLARWFTAGFLARPSEQLDYARRRLDEVDTAVLAQTWRAIADHDARAALQRLVMPVTCVAGLGDVSAPPEQVEHMASLVPQARYVALPGGHLLPLESPRALSHVLAQARDASR